jgi:hypothetical protein
MTNTIRFIGDVHGHYNRYKKIIAGVPRSIQLGDMGVGFRYFGGARHGTVEQNPPHYAMVRGNHRFIRGNHDNPETCRQHSQWIPDGHFEDGIMFVGGAVSVDRAWCTEGYNWWPEEELSPAELQRLIAFFVANRPRVMVTHDCPEEAAGVVLNRFPIIGSAKRQTPSRTRLALQEMWAVHPPALWLFGHYHISFDRVLHGGRDAGTRFIGLAELEYRDLDIS